MKISLLTFGILLSGAALAAPANDSFTNAVVISGLSGISTTIDITDATAETNEPVHAEAGPFHSIWWQYTAPTNGLLALDTLQSEEFDTVLGVYTNGSSISNLIEVASNDDNDDDDIRSRVTLDVLQGETYWIAVDGYDDSEFGNAVLSWEALLQEGAGSDLFADATAISGNSGLSATTDTSGASAEIGESSHAGDGPYHSVWWKYTATTNGVLELNTWYSDADFDTLLAVYTGNEVSALTEVASNDQSNESDQSQTFLEVFLGETYWITVDGYDNTTGNAVLSWSFQSGSTLQRPANDDFMNAILISSNAGTSDPINTVLATSEAGEPEHDGSGGFNSVWWQYTAPDNGITLIDSFGSDFDTVLGVYTGSMVSALTTLLSNDDANGVIQSQVLLTTLKDVTYWIAVDGFYGEAGEAVLSWAFYSDTFDIDHDGITDADEAIADSDAYNSNDWFRITGISSNTVYFNSSPNRQYTLFGSTNLNEDAWEPLSDAQLGSGGMNSLSDSEYLPTKYYKVKVGLPSNEPINQ